MRDLFRKNYTPLTDDQKALVAKIKDKGQELLDLIDQCGDMSEQYRLRMRAWNMLEAAVMFAVKAATTGAEHKTRFEIEQEREDRRRK